MLELPEASVGHAWLAAVCWVTVKLLDVLLGSNWLLKTFELALKQQGCAAFKWNYINPEAAAFECNDSCLMSANRINVFSHQISNAFVLSGSPQIIFNNLNETSV